MIGTVQKIAFHKLIQSLSTVASFIEIEKDEEKVILL